MYKAVVFDLDGTLVYTLVDLMNAINNALINKGYPFKYDLEGTKKLIGAGTKTLCRRAISSLKPSDKQVEELFEEFTKEYNLHQLDNVALYDGVMDTLNKIKERNIKVAVFSNKVDHNTKEILKYLCGDFEFDYVLGQTKELPLKPDPAGLFKILDNINVEVKDILYVGDSDTDMKTGNNAKADVCAVTYGFRDKDILETYNPKYMIDNIKEILDLL